MASYATVPAADLESEATLLNSKPKTKTSLLVGGVAAAAFLLGALSMTALRTSPSGVLTRTATSLSACDGGPLAVGDAVELQNLNAAPALNGKAGVITAINGGITTVKMDDGGSVRNVPSVKVEASGCPSVPHVGTNDSPPGEGDGAYSYSYSYDVSHECAEEVGFNDCLDNAVLAGEVTQDEVEAAHDAVASGFEEDDDWDPTADTCEEYQKWPKFAELCGSWTLGVCDDEYKEWVAVWKFSASMAWHPIFDVHAGGSAASSPRSSLKARRILIRSTARSTATP